jgi:hypothetical protein
MRNRRPSVVTQAVVSIILGVAALPSSLGLGQAAAASLANGVTWSIDHTAKTITADVRITLVPTCATPQFQPAKFGEARASWCNVTDEIANQIKSSIERIWNGHKYYCYDIIVHVDIKIDQSPTGPDPANRVKVRIDQTPGAVETNTKAGNSSKTWDSNSPSDALRPANNGTASSTWAYPPLGGRANAYAHETGHILGLHDGYEEYIDANGIPRCVPGRGHPRT